MADDQAKFRDLLNSLLSSDNSIRSQAEEAFQTITTDKKIGFLLSALQDVTMPEEIRQIAAVLLRRVLSSEFQEFFPELPVEAQNQLKEQLLRTLEIEQTRATRQKVCDVVSEAARNLIDSAGNNQWPEFLQCMCNWANSPDPNMKEASLRMFTSVPGAFGNLKPEFLDLIKRMLAASLQPDVQYAVRFQAVKAIGAFIIAHETRTEVHKAFEDMLPFMMMITAESIEQDDCDDGLLKVLIDLAESTPRFLRSQVQPIVDLCMKIFGNSDYEDSIRQLCLEVIVTLAESAPSMMRKFASNQIANLTPMILFTMADLEEEEDWSVQDDIEDEDNESNSAVADSALDRICCALGGKFMLPLLMSHIPGMLHSAEWMQRRAALMAISCAGEGCHKQMEAVLDDIVVNVLGFLNDSHPRVRHAACNAVGQMSTDFAPIFEKKFHSLVVPSLLRVLDDDANPRVQAHAAAALVNFSEDCPKSILSQYLDSIMGKLEVILNAKFKELIQSGVKLVLVQVVTTIASVADTAEKEFIVYYDRLMPYLKYIITNANTEELKMLRGKTIECVSLIGLAVGKEKFVSDASDIMQLLFKTYTDGNLPEDDPQTSYLITAWARVCKILGKDFEQYLPHVMGPVMKMAAIKPEVAMLDNDDLEAVESDLDWQFVNLGEQQHFGIRTAGLEDKASACEMLVCYARELKEGFAEYAEEVVRLMVPLLKFYFHDGVRTSAAESLPHLLECAKVKGPVFLQGMWAYIYPELLKAIDTEPEQEVLIEFLYSLAKCIEKLGCGCLSNEAMIDVIKIVNKLMEQHFKKALERLQRREGPEYDEGEEEELEDENEVDAYCLSKISDIVHALMMTYTVSFYPYLDQIIQHFVNLLKSDRPSTDLQWGICIFDDIIEFGGPACAKYRQFFEKPLTASVLHELPEIRQAAVYGCGVLAQFGGSEFAQTCAEVLPSLIKVISEPDSKQPEKVNATENAISAVTKIMKYNHGFINVNEILERWMTWLPLVEDCDEAPHVYGYLAELIEERHPLVIGVSGEKLPIAISAFAASLAAGALQVESEAAQRLLVITRGIQSNAELFTACIAALTPSQQQALHEALSAPAPVTVPA